MRNIHQIMSAVSVLCLLALPLQAQEEGMTLEDFLKAAEKDNNLQEQIAESTDLFDINSDNKISLNEVKQSIKGLASVPDNIYKDEEKKEMETYLLQAFYESDLNQDNELTESEGTALTKAWQIYALKKQFHKMDKNGDGIINEEDMPTLEESTQQLEESMKRLDEAKNRLEAANPEEIANNWMKSMNTAIADEDYYQMDKNHDNCVTRAEYVAYQAQNMDEKLTDELMEKVRNLDLIEEYLTIKKATSDCLTKDEYITDENHTAEEVIKALKEKKDKETEKQYAEILFETIDEDKDSIVTTEEYIKYETAREKYIYRNSPELLNQEIFEILADVFNSKTKAGKMTKEEFVAFYIETTDEEDEIKQ